MGGYTEAKYFTVTMPSGGTLTSSIDLARGWDSISLEIPSMASGTDIYIQGCRTPGATFRRHHHRPTISNSTPGPYFVNSSITNCFIHLENVNMKFLAIEHTTAMTATEAVYNIVCM